MVPLVRSVDSDRGDGGVSSFAGCAVCVAKGGRAETVGGWGYGSRSLLYWVEPMVG